MPQGPYAPPSARVADRPERQGPNRSLVVLLWSSFALGFPIWYLRASRDSELQFHPVFILFVLAICLFAAALNVLIYRGRDWARILVMVLILIEAIVLLIPMEEPVPAGALENILTAASLLLDLVALYLLLSRPGASWFQRA
jgi:hypothetical protein